MRLVLALVLLASCGAKDAGEDYIRKSKQIEGRVRLKMISRNAKQIVEETGALPIGHVGPTPPKACCEFAEKKCPRDPNEWNNPIWEAFYMTNDLPKYFQYTYESDGTRFTATATGDVMCEGKPVTFTIAGAIGANKVLAVDESDVESSTKK